MLRPKIVLALGVWLIVVALLGAGIPFSWQIALYVLTGVFLVAWFFFFVVRQGLLHRVSNRQDTFVQNGEGEEGKKINSEKI